MTQAVDGVVMLSNSDEDLCLCSYEQMADKAQQIADDDQRTITARDAVSDEVIDTFYARS